MLHPFLTKKNKTMATATQESLKVKKKGRQSYMSIDTDTVERDVIPTVMGLASIRMERNEIDLFMVNGKGLKRGDFVFLKSGRFNKSKFQRSYLMAWYDISETKVKSILKK